ncbi:hypothetical protein CC2G_001289 [Coprinopsis cinerea AmutBmut pab1-1]|nr:hypothetical protein CC2G_001289 [Coprinopsis cinerea AmutBmut pab1-1]
MFSVQHTATAASGANGRVHASILANLLAMNCHSFSKFEGQTFKRVRKSNRPPCETATGTSRECALDPA